VEAEGEVKKMKKIETSIIILTKNAGNNFKKTLDKVFSQKYKNFEVIIIDSSSSDNTLDIAKKYPVKIIKIEQEEFGHGKTRNLGARLAKGKYVVYLTQDAIPKNNIWLSELITPLKNKKIAGVYSRQVSKENEKEIEKFFYFSLYPDKSKIWARNNFTQGDNIFSDESSAIKREVWLKHPFNDKIILAEDYYWAQEVLKKGYKLIYRSSSQVIHSHSYSLGQLFKRNFDIGVAYKIIYFSKEKRKSFFKKGIRIFWNETRYLIKNGKAYLVPYAILKDTTKYIAVIIGKNSNILPKSINKMLSNYPRYWR
jgi:rhamnosyltransferase